MSRGFNEYDPSRVVMSFAGIDINGFADGSMIAAERDEDGFTKKAGTQGDVTRIANRNQGGSVTVRLLQNAPCNSLLSALAKIDEKNGGGKGPLQIVDLNGVTVLHAQIAWIKKYPKVEYSNDENGREWVFDCAALDVENIGGNPIGF